MRPLRRARSFVILLALFAPALAAAQQTTERLAEQEPFDRITLDEENQGAVLKVEPLDLPGRRVPANPDPESRLRLKLYAQPDKTYEVAWKHIKKVELFEELLMAEAQQAISQNRLDDAYLALQFLQQNFPNSPGIEGQVQAYLYISAGRLYQEQRWPEAMAVLEELHKINPDYKLTQTARPLPEIFAAVLDKIVSGYIKSGDYRSARLLVARIGRDYGDKHAAAIATFEQELQSLAAKERDAARGFITGGKLREANRAARRMSEIWPDVEGGRALAAEVAAKYPLIVVGVSQPAGALDVRRVDDWAARRAGGLTTRPLLEFRKPGVEGGQYAFRYGSVQISEDRKRISLQLSRDQMPEGSTATGYDLARRLLAVTRPEDPDFAPTLSSILSGVTVKDVLRVEIDLKHSYVVPEAALQLPWNPDAARGETTGAFIAEPAAGEERPFVAVERQPGAQSPAEISERVFDDPAQAIAALRRGEIDVLDRVFPADVARLSNDSGVRVIRYALPTLHYLVPSPKRPLGQHATLRRAMAYAIHREAILNEQLLGGASLAGCRLINGPFSPGISDTDPLAYAVDPQLPQRPHEPRLAATLISLVDRERKAEAEKNMKKHEPLAIVIGYPQSEMARVACQSIEAQLTTLGLACTLKPLPAGETRDLNDECDFVYVEATMCEPMIDARRLLGPGGAARSEDPYINLALRRLDEAATWSDARARLRELHRVVHADVSIIPLWQVVEHFACRSELAGLEENAVTLYDNVAAWRRGDASATAKAER